jgi:glycosyltransferase involved in cell wall biosynthesis
VLAQLGVSEPPVHLIAVIPPHIERLRPANRPAAPAPAPGRPIHFAALNAAASTQKGADLLIEAVRRLDQISASPYRLTLLGWIGARVRAALGDHPAVCLHGPYQTDDLGHLLAEVDIGLMPSGWEEVYGYASLEFLAAGIPVIGNAIGAIPEHIRPGQTGWLNQTGTADGLARLMADVARDPGEVARLRASVSARRDQIVPALSGQVRRLRTVYEGLAR